MFYKSKEVKAYMANKKRGTSVPKRDDYSSSRKDHSSNYKKRRDPRKRDSSDTKQINSDKLDSNYVPGVNDPAYWNWNPELVDGAGNVNWKNVLGTRLSTTGSQGGWNLLDPYPGIMKFTTICGPGNAETVDDPVNVASMDLFNTIRRTVSGVTNFDPMDVEMVVLAFDEICQFWTFAVRAISFMYTYNIESTYMPKRLIYSMGIDYDDLSKNTTGWRNYLNAFAARINVLNIPGDLPIFKRHRDLFMNVYVDKDVRKAQMYYYNPAGFRWYDEVTEPGKSRLRWLANTYEVGSYIPENVQQAINTFDKALNSLHIGRKSYEAQPITLDVFSTIGNFMLDRLLDSEDVGTISAMILKGLGEDKCYKIPMLPEFMAPRLVFEREVLDQIRNITMVGYHSSSYNYGWYGNKFRLDITTEPSSLETGQPFIKYEPTVYDQLQVDSPTMWKKISGRPELYEYCDGFTGKILQSNLDNPSSMDTIIGTRLTIQKHNESYGVPAGQDYLAMTNKILCGTEFVLNAKMFISAPDESVGIKGVHFIPEVVVNAENFYDAIYGYITASAFDYVPSFTVLETYYDGEGISNAYSHIAQEVDNYVCLSADQIKQMHYVSLLSAFHVPTFK